MREINMVCSSNDEGTKMENLERALKFGFGSRVGQWPLRHIHFCGQSVDAEIADFVKQVLGNGEYLLVADDNTFKAFGEKIAAVLKCQAHVFPAIPLNDKTEPALRPDLKTAEDIAARLKGFSALIAVGSGVVNDICKYAAFQANRPYMVFPTAASMNGYASSNASLIVPPADNIGEGAILKGLLKRESKNSFTAVLPAGIFIDMSVICAAPRRLAAAGFADLLCRQTAQTDWLLSHLLLDTPYNDMPFKMLAEVEGRLCGNPGGIASADKESLELLMEGLIISGLGMHMTGGSMPSSQGEHMLAQNLEFYYPRLKKYLHGELIGVTTIFMNELQEELMQTNNWELKHALLESMIGAPELSKFSPSNMIKLQDNLRLENFGSILERLRGVSRNQNLSDILQKAGCKWKPGQIRLSYDNILGSAHLAFMIRDRFTFLDIYPASLN